jgi:monovalent cation:H+ antiporter, CPA1 family
VGGVVGELTLDAVRLFVAMLAIAILVAWAVRRTAIPSTVALVLVGLGITVLRPNLGLVVTPELVLVVFLPGLIFEAAFNTRIEDLRPSIVTVLVLAIPGVLITAALVAVVLNVAVGLPLELAFVVGAIVSATDPAAVIATFKRLRAPRHLATIVDAESLLNDGTAIVLFALALEFVAGGGSVGGAVVSFIVIVGVSSIIGLVAGVVGGWLVGRVDDHVLEIGVTVVLAYGTYLLADGLHVSGVIATVVAAVACGTVVRRDPRDRRAAEAIDTVWEFLAFFLTAFAFLLVGFVITPEELVGAFAPIAWTLAAIEIARAIAVYGLVGLPDRLLGRGRGGPRLPLSWLHVMFWSGLRGAVAVALALSLPDDLPQRSLLQNITFGVVLVTLIVHGTTAELVVRRTGAGADRFAAAPSPEVGGSVEPA